jgi:hypothetical protein
MCHTSAVAGRLCRRLQLLITVDSAAIAAVV